MNDIRNGINFVVLLVVVHRNWSVTVSVRYTAIFRYYYWSCTSTSKHVVPFPTLKTLTHTCTHTCTHTHQPYNFSLCLSTAFTYLWDSENWTGKITAGMSDRLLTLFPVFADLNR